MIPLLGVWEGSPPSPAKVLKSPSLAPECGFYKSYSLGALSHWLSLTLISGLNVVF